jgi:hypothetical protein
MCAVMSGFLSRKIRFHPPHLIAFFVRKRKEGVDTAFYFGNDHASLSTPFSKSRPYLKLVARDFG